MSLATCQLNPAVYQGASTQRAINIHCNITAFSHISQWHLQTQRRVVPILLEGYGLSVQSALWTLWVFRKGKRLEEKEKWEDKKNGAKEYL